MTSRDQIIETLRWHMPDLRRDFQIRSLELFGSYARGDARQRSDVDLLVKYDIEPGLYRFIELKLHLSKLLGVKVDLVEPDGLKAEIAGNILAEAFDVEEG